MRADLPALAGRWRSAAPIRAVLVPALVDAETAAALRRDLRFEPFFLADRGHYEISTTPSPSLFESLAKIASAIAGQPLAPARARWLRLVHGDFALYKDDARTWRGHACELVVDLSAAATGAAEVMFSNGRAFFPVPQTPLAGALVERRGGVTRYDRYLSHRVGEAEVFRLSLALHPEDPGTEGEPGAEHR